MNVEIESIASEIKKLKDKSRKSFQSQLIDLMIQIESSMMLRGPYRLVLDSNIVMRLESFRQGRITEGVLSALLAFLFAKRLSIHIDLVIRPVIFYEFIRKSNVRNLREHWDKIKDLKSLVEDSLDTTLFFDGVDTYESTVQHLKIIQRDEEKIIKVLQEYQRIDWRFDFFRTGGGYSGFPAKDGSFVLVPPQFAADGLYKKVDLEYFHEPSARAFFLQHIERNIAECPHNDARVIKHYPNESDYILTKVLRLTTKGNLEGLGDIDVFSICNLQHQFQNQANGRYAPASIGMSIDGNLSKALQYYSTLNITSRKMGGARDDIELDQHKAAMEAFIEDGRRIKEGEKRVAISRSKLNDFLSELHELGALR